MTSGYIQITQQEAKAMMALNDGHVIVDVRRQDEYDAGHIPGAILIPNESIGTAPPSDLPDLDQIILIYCRSGNRSKQAAQKLANMGYTRIYEFGGINTWDGEIVTGESSGGSLPESQESGGSSDSNESSESIESNRSIESGGSGEAPELAMRLWIGEAEVPVSWEDNPSVQALRELLPLQIQMSMYGGFEQVGPLGESLVRNDEQTVTSFGDIVLYAGNQIVIFYGSNSWAYTRLGHIDLSQEEMTELLSSGDVVVTISAE